MTLLTNEFDKYDYLSRSDHTLTFLPFLFLFIGTALVSADFLTKPKQYHTFILARSSSRKEAMLRTRGGLIEEVVLYVAAFTITIYMLSLFGLPEEFSGNMPLSEMKLVFLLIVHALLKMIVLMLLAMITFLLYQVKNTPIAFLGGVLAIFILYLTDVQWKIGNIILFNYSHYFVDSIAISLLLYCGIYWYTLNGLKLDYID